MSIQSRTTSHTANFKRLVAIAWLIAFCSICSTGMAETLDFSRATVVLPENASPQVEKAAEMLVRQVHRRSRLHWSTGKKTDGQPATIRLLFEPEISQLPDNFKSVAIANKPEGYAIYSVPGEPVIYVVGHDARGILFGVGRLLRELKIQRDSVQLDHPLRVVTSPKTPIRGHQLGYRPKTNSYDAWDIDQWEQYYCDLIVFGTNAIELIPPRSDDDADSYHFPRPPLEMMTRMSRLAAEYGLDLWIWYPAMDADYAKPEQVEFALKEWSEVFQALPKIDKVFVPGGDPGHTRPVHLMNLLEKQAKSLKSIHPKAEMWMSPQSFDKTWFAEFVEIMKKQPDWLSGIVFGPQNYVDLKTLREVIPARYPIRGYPDITHNLMCQHPVPNWDFSFALTQGREVINPRPLDQATIFHYYKKYTPGFISYSEGCHDDVNKIVWSALGWDDQQPVIAILREYARYFIGPEFEDGFANGLLALEQNWQGPLIANSSVDTTLIQFQAMEKSARPETLRNWRFQQALYRSYYDAWLRQRLIAETARQQRAESVLRQATLNKTQSYLEQAITILKSSDTETVAPELRTRVNELADSLFQSAKMQLATIKYHGKPGRGTSQDQIDVPLNDRPWLVPQLQSIQTLKSEKERLSAIETVLNRTNPGMCGFYDDLGNPAQQPHLVQTGKFADDPDFRQSVFNGFEYRLDAPIAWCRYAQTTLDQPLIMKYNNLNSKRKYKVKVTYAGDNFKVKIQMLADGRMIHGPIMKPNPHRTLEFMIPEDLTGDGSLELHFQREPGLGGNGRGCQVAEVWLVPVD